MKAYYGCFIYNNKEYVIKFKIAGSLHYSERDRAFIDEKYYVRSVDEVICMAAFDSHPLNIKGFGIAYLISWDEYDNKLANGVKRWTYGQEYIKWD